MASAKAAWLPAHSAARLIGFMRRSIGIADTSRKCIACYRLRLLQFSMLTGKELGAALKAAMRLKGVIQREVAAEFGVEQPSVSEWLTHGRISKEHINRLVAYFGGVVPPSHWGLPDDWTVPLAAAPGDAGARSVLALKNPTIALIVEMADKMSARQQEQLLSVANLLSGPLGHRLVMSFSVAEPQVPAPSAAPASVQKRPA